MNTTPQSCYQAVAKIQYNVTGSQPHRKSELQRAIYDYQVIIKKFVISADNGWRESDPMLTEILEIANKDVKEPFTFYRPPSDYFYYPDTNKVYYNNHDINVEEDSLYYWPLFGLNLLNFDLYEYIKFLEHQLNLSKDRIVFLENLEGVIRENKYNLLPSDAWPFVERWMNVKFSSIKPYAKPRQRKENWQRGISIFTYALLETEQNGFINVERKQLLQAIYDISGYSVKNLDNEISGLYNDSTKKTYTSEDYSKVRKLLQAMLIDVCNG